MKERSVKCPKRLLVTPIRVMLREAGLSASMHLVVLRHDGWKPSLHHMKTVAHKEGLSGLAHIRREFANFKWLGHFLKSGIFYQYLLT